MDETEEFLEFTRILFPNQPGAVLDPEEFACLSRLGSQGLDSLNGEVARLNEELAIVEHQTRDMASQNYQIFVQSAQTTNLIKKSLDEGNVAVDKLLDTTFPHIKTQVDAFANDPCKEFTSSQHGIKIVSQKRQQLSKILDMPWIVRKCLAEEKLPDAIKILQVAQDMIKVVTMPPQVLSKTCDEVMELKSEIQHALMTKLSSGNIGLSDCLQTVSLLRSFFTDDKSLRFRFLQSRMKDVPFSESRSWIFDTLTQHRAAFGSDSNHYLSTWVVLQINRVLTDLQKLLESGENIASLMTQATYIGESIARVGADFRGLLVPIFVEHINRKVTHDLTQSEIHFVRNLHQFNLSTVVTFSNADSANFDLPSANDLHPPKQLIAHVPLATYLNNVLTLLNTIGKCPLIQCTPTIVERINTSISKIGDEIDSWGKSEWLTWDVKEQTEFNRMKRYFEHLLVPHIDKVFKIVFPPVNISKITGMGVAKCAEMIQIKYNTTNTSASVIENISNE